MKPVGLYIHFPWCVQKCPYCDFNSHAIQSGIDEGRYIQALLNDFDQQQALLSDTEIKTVFMGGGTPSVFSPQSIQTLLNELKQRVDFACDAEITLEANPGTTDQEKFDGFLEAGINRLSIGVQSFQPAHLKKLGRIHSPNEAVNAATHAKKSGFDNFNLDLMYALPNQTLEEALSDLERALELKPTHLSHYQLTIEPNTEFWMTQPELPDDDLAWDMLDAVQARLLESGFNQYEVSAYAQAGRASKHNLNYWTYGDFYGIGAGAHGKMQTESGTVRTRRANSPERYMSDVEQNKGLMQTDLGEKDLVFEFMLNTVRLKSGVPIERFNETTGLDIETHLRPRLQKAIEKGLLKNDPTQIQSTPMGWNFMNNLQQLFI